MPDVNCGFLPAPPLPPGVSWFAMIVKFRIHDAFGNVSAEVTNSGVRLLPQGMCGF